MLIDSNQIIESAKPENAFLREFIATNSPAVSAVSIVEVLGYHQLAPVERLFFETFFQQAEVYEIDSEIIDEAVRLRQERKMTLGDALIAATALIHELVLVTRNEKDFKHLSELHMLNPFENQSRSLIE